MDVSFVIPLFNCLELTRVTVASLQATLPPWLRHEIILVDDGSTDGTRDWLATLRAPFRVVLNERNLAYAGANNRAAAIASGTHLVLLNNDLVLTRGWLEPMLAAHRRLGQRAGIVGNVQLNVATGAIDHSGMFINLKGKPEHVRTQRPWLLRAIAPTRRVAFLTGACMLISADLWRQLGGFDESFVNGCEEVDICLRARAAGRINAVALRSVIRHHVSASPGRNRRNEENSRRLAVKWRHELPRLAARRWCWDYLQREWRPPHSSLDYADGMAALFFGLHLRRQPPQLALDGMRAALDREFERWEQILPARDGGGRT